MRRPFCVYTIITLKLTFDPTKNLANAVKHGIPLSHASAFEWDTAIMWPEIRRNYGESRMACLGYIRFRLYAPVFVDRDGERRIVSLRKANRREIERYAKT